MIGTVITLGVSACRNLAQTTSRWSAREPNATAVQVKAYSRPLVSPDATAVSVVTLGFKIRSYYLNLRYLQLMVDSKLINKDLTSEAVYLLYLAIKQNLLVGIG